MNILENEAALAILRDASEKLRAIGIHSDMQTCASKHGASIALIASETVEGAAAGYVASFLGCELTMSEPDRFCDEVANRLADRAIDDARHASR
ncbi:hypothetical protein LMG29542_02467 [Paraburkholderia humisilvae]|uniref:Uncharacterized protein n=2 Tax=Paraburkholderia humisilvae TaxID=627669 RepID=A0A6J5DNM7_9BURK|nr:hypothetical protein LMG29542_02467 [Paraburkholderia humisilvae]